MCRTSGTQSQNARLAEAASLPTELVWSKEDEGSFDYKNVYMASTRSRASWITKIYPIIEKLTSNQRWQFLKYDWQYDFDV